MSKNPNHDHPAIKKRILQCLLIENWGFIYKMVSRNFPTSLKRITEIGRKVKAGMRTLTAVCL